MKMVLRLALLAAFIAAGVWLWTIRFPSPQNRPQTAGAGRQ